GNRCTPAAVPRAQLARRHVGSCRRRWRDRARAEHALSAGVSDRRGRLGRPVPPRSEPGQGAGVAPAGRERHGGPRSDLAQDRRRHGRAAHPRKKALHGVRRDRAGPSTRAPAHDPVTGSPLAETAFVGATLIDGTGSEPLADSAVVVGDGRISWVGRNTDLDRSPELQVVDINGTYLIPGLLDANVHLVLHVYPEILLR